LSIFYSMILAPMLLAIVTAQTLPISWGFGTSAYQVEGAYNEDGKGLNVWDYYYNLPAHASEPNGHVAIDHYHNMKSDIAYLGQLNATAYRFSVSWSRILPNCSGPVNPAGIKFYDDMINEIIKNGATPVLTLYHWDTPQKCHSDYGSWTNERIVADFTNFADIIFENYGNRVTHYLTINEPSAECGWGYESDFWPPAAKLGKSAKYVCQHLSNLAHGSVVQLARKKYASKKFQFGMPLIISYADPLDPNDPRDVAAAERLMRYAAMWNWGPLITGDYPDFLKNDPAEGPFLPKYTENEKSIMKGTMDFVAINYYSSAIVKYAPNVFPGEYEGTTRNGQALGPTSGTPWQTVYGPGLRGLLKFLAAEFKGFDIFITECGVSVPNEQNMTPEETLNDPFRLDFWQSHLKSLQDAILVDKVPVKMFLAWSLFDNFEWKTYDQRFGAISIDYKSPALTRRIKNSTYFLSNNLKTSKSPFALPKTNSAAILDWIGSGLILLTL
jgi:beta-glucosidase